MREQFSYKGIRRQIFFSDKHFTHVTSGRAFILMLSSFSKYFISPIFGKISRSSLLYLTNLNIWIVPGDPESIYFTLKTLYSQFTNQLFEFDIYADREDYCTLIMWWLKFNISITVNTISCFLQTKNLGLLNTTDRKQVCKQCEKEERKRKNHLSLFLIE